MSAAAQRAVWWPVHLVLCILTPLTGWAWIGALDREVLPAREIFQGVTYRCEWLEGGSEGSGWMHLVRADLNAAGIELYVTPTDPNALRGGWQYVLRNAAAVARGEALAVTINASQFKPRIPSLYLRGDLATTGECVVSESKANQFGAHTYLLWFADDLTPHLETTKPVPARAIKQARWGVGGGYWLVKSREPNNFLHDAGRDSVDRRTALGIDSRRKTLWLAVFQRASHYLAAHTLAHEGASDALMVDGGTSSTMVIGDGAREMESGTVFGGSRPQAIHLGIRARRRED